MEESDPRIFITSMSGFNDSLKALITNNKSGMTTGNPRTAISAALLPALEAIAETIVKALANPMQPKINAG